MPTFISMEEKKEQIIRRTLDLFTKMGIKSLNMGDIASFQKISKKTLYHFFRDKNDLVCSCVEYELAQTDKMLKEIIERGLNAIDESYEISRFVVNQLSELPPTLFSELESFYPDAFDLLEKHRKECVGENINRNLKKGLEEGLYRREINVEIVSAIYLSLLYNFLSSRLMDTRKFSFREIYEEMFKYHIYGISSEKGKDFLKLKFGEK